MSSELKYLEADALAALLNEKSVVERNSDKSDQIVIVDVRGADEFSEDGHIKGAISAPSTEWADSAFVDGILNDHIVGAGSSKKLVFHCAHSQQRGPKCARILQERLEAHVASTGGDISSVPQV